MLPRKQQADSAYVCVQLQYWRLFWRDRVI